MAFGGGQAGPCMGRCMVGVWHGCMAWCNGLPRLVRLELGVGSSLDGDCEEVVGVVFCEMEKPQLNLGS